MVWKKIPIWLHCICTVPVIPVKRLMTCHSSFGIAKAPGQPETTYWLGKRTLATTNNYAPDVSWLGISTGIENWILSSRSAINPNRKFRSWTADGIYSNYDQLRNTFSAPDQKTPWRKVKEIRYRLRKTVHLQLTKF